MNAKSNGVESIQTCGDTVRNVSDGDLDTLPLPSRATHIPALDSIRGLAILSVMLYHFNHGASATGQVSAFVFRIMRLGGSGVDLFFVLSGFLITGILVGSQHDRHYFRSFYIRRTLRIMPLYYGVLAVACFVLPRCNVIVGPSNWDDWVWLWCYATNFRQAWTNSYPFGSLNHFWSLAVEEHFYLFWPFVIYLFSRVAAMWICMACIICAIAWRIGLVMSGDHTIAAYVLTPCRMDALAYGAFIALARKGCRSNEWLPAGSIVVCILSCTILLYLFLKKGHLSEMDSTVLVLRSTLSTGVFGAVVLLGVRSSPGTLVGRCFNVTALRFLGKYSYGLYVYHRLLVPYLMRWCPPQAMAEWTGSELAGQLLYSVFGIGASVAVAMLSWHLFEKHFLKMKDVFAPNPSSVVIS